ncbi:efflux RND transporter permease subunit [Leptospira kirschneri]|uniref:efflux RND transporter permease subunit n=3 Tax=Leptospira kirschneri TaxID=29507 RepID=UPI0039F1F2C0
MNQSKLPSKITIQMIVGAILLFGVISAFMLNYSLFPVVKNPALSIIVDYPGTDAETVENTITIPLENQVSTIGGISEIRSTSEKGKSLIRLDFENDTNIDVKTLEIKERIETIINTFPKEVRKPRVLNFDPNEMPIAVISLNATDPRSLGELRAFADSIVKKDIEGINGVSKVTVSGGKIKEILISFDIRKLNSYNIRLADINEAIYFNNRTSTIASIEEKGGLYQVRLRGKFSKLDDLVDLPIASPEIGKSITLGNVANIQNSYRDEDNTYRVNGNQNIGIYVYKKYDANILSISSEIKKTISHLSQDGSKFDLLYNQADNIRNTYFNLICIIAITIAILFFAAKRKGEIDIPKFTGTILSQLILSFLLISFIHFLLKKDFDLLCVLSIYLSFAIWIVFYFNFIQNHTIDLNGEKKLLLFTSASIPILFLPGILLNSTVAVNLIRMAIMTSIGVLNNYIVYKYIHQNLSANTLDRFPTITTIPEKSKIQSVSYEPKKNKRDLILNFLLIIAPIVMIFALIQSSKEVYFNVEDDRIYGYVELPADSNFEYTDEIVQKIESKLVENPNVKDVISQVEPGHAFLIINYHKNFFSSDSIIPSLNQSVGKQNPAFCYFTKESDLGRMKEISLDIVGQSHSDLNKSVPKIANLITNSPGIHEVILNFKQPRNELQLDLNNRDPLLQNSDIGSFLRTVVQGSVISKYNENNNELDIRVRASKEFRDSEKQLNKFLIKNNSGEFSSIASSFTQRETLSPIKFFRKNKRPNLSISVRTDSYNPNTLLKLVQNHSQTLLNNNERIELNHRIEKLSKSNTNFTVYIILTLATCFFLFVIYTESLKTSFTYFCSLLFSYCTFASIYLIIFKTYDISFHIGSVIILISLMLHILANFSEVKGQNTIPINWDFYFVAIGLFLPLLILSNPELNVFKKVFGLFLISLVLSRFLLIHFNFRFANIFEKVLSTNNISKISGGKNVRR